MVSSSLHTLMFRLDSAENEQFILPEEHTFCCVFLLRVYYRVKEAIDPDWIAYIPPLHGYSLVTELLFFDRIL